MSQLAPSSSLVPPHLLPHPSPTLSWVGYLYRKPSILNPHETTGLPVVGAQHPKDPSSPAVSICAHPTQPCSPSSHLERGPQESSLSGAEQKETGRWVCRSHLGLESRGWARRSSKWKRCAPHGRPCAISQGQCDRNTQSGQSEECPGPHQDLRGVVCSMKEPFKAAAPALGW